MVNFLHFAFLGPEAYLLFGSEHTVHNLTISGTHYGDVVSKREAPIAIGHDLNSGYVYWSDILKEKIERAQLQGDGSVETVVDKVKHSNGINTLLDSFITSDMLFFDVQ